ncbi:unnamed protein product [Allacma fusca]|uniref:Uncharacterized protein n=1 Tax=Allacma fusca TaxID=39272 RepID=A0A8J2K1P3_9HEXA|nr:unnamed protein product [Allacma fusca]
MALAVMGAPQAQQLQTQQQQQQQAASSQTVAQSRDAPVYSDAQYSQGGYAAGASAAGSYPAAAASTSYGAPASGYGAPATGGNYAQPGGNQGYYYYYYPEQKESASYHAPKETYTATDSYGIDPLGIIAVLAVAGLVIAGLALLFPGWAYVRSDENVYYRSLDGGSPSFLGLTKEDYHTLTSLVLTAIEGEDCIEKMMCDAGKLVKKVKKADAFLRVMEDLAPTTVAGTIKKLRTAMKKGEECKNMGCAKKKAA